jgi:hypothetical protein
MDLHEADKNHLLNAHLTAFEIMEKNKNNWIKIDCEKN